MVEYFKRHHNIDFTPAGIWTLDSTGKKQAVDSKRYDYLDWSNYPNDNMARTKIPKGIIILDIDDYKTVINQDSTITLLEHNITLPLGLYTQTSKPGSYHIYYSVTDSQLSNIGKTIRKLNKSNIDILTYGYVVFEWHSFSAHNELHEGDILPIPEDLLDMIAEHNNYKVPLDQAQTLSLSSNVQRANLVKAYIDGTLPSTTQAFNSFIKSVVPVQFHIKNKKAYKWSDFSISYPLINGIAVKLTTTRELDYQDHVLPTIHKILISLGINPSSSKSSAILGQILPSLPQHVSESAYNDSTDTRPFTDLVHTQTNTSFPLLRTAHLGRARFIHIDKYSLQPVPTKDGFFMEQSLAELYHPELFSLNEDGSQGKWDASFTPVVETVIDPYKEPYYLDEYSRHTVNLSIRSKYVRQAEPVQDENNILIRAVKSSVHPLYVPLLLRWYAEVIYGSSSPIMMVWMATREGVKGGTGKSMITLYLPAKILGAQASSIQEKTLTSGYSVSLDKRLLSLEEATTSGKQQQETYEAIKRLQSPVESMQNDKFGAMGARRVKVAISGSSNKLLSIDPSDRRILCLEPAHLEYGGYPRVNEPLPEADKQLLSKILHSEGDEYDVQLQGFANYIYSIYNEPMSDEMYRYLYHETIETIYRKDWVRTNITYTKSIMYNLIHPNDLVDSIHSDRAYDLIEYIEYVIRMYNAPLGKCSLSWKWFSGIAKMVASENDIDLTKASLSKALGEVKFANGSEWAVKASKNSNFPDWPKEMYTFAMTEEVYKEYIEVLNTLKNIPKDYIEGLD